MKQETYLNYGVYKNSILFMALEGNFASKAWTESDEAFHQIAGTSFRACTADDGKVYNIGKYDIRRLESDEEFERLWKQAHPAFRVFCTIEQLPKNTPENYMDWCMYGESIAAVYSKLCKDFPFENNEEALIEYYTQKYSQE